MIEAVPSRPKSKPERFAEADESIRDEAIRLAVHYSNVTPGDVVHVENLIKLAAADAREPDGTVVLTSSGKKLSDVGGKNILGLAIRIAERAEETVRSRIIGAWAFNILYESSPRTVSVPRALAEVERILKSSNRVIELEQTRFRTGPLSSLDDEQFESLKQGVGLYDPALAEAFDDDEEELKLLRHWNTVHPPLNALVDDPSYDPTAGSAMVATLLRGQRDLVGRVPKQFIDSLSDVEHARLVEFLGTNAEAKRKWYGKKEPLSPERRALLSRFPAIRHLLIRMEDSRLPIQPEITPRSERAQKREIADEAYGRKHIHPESLKILEAHWKGADAEKVGIYLRLWSRQVRFLRAGGAPHTPEEAAIYAEGQRILNEAEDQVHAARRSGSKAKLGEISPSTLNVLQTSWGTDEAGKNKLRAYQIALQKLRNRRRLTSPESALMREAAIVLSSGRGFGAGPAGESSGETGGSPEVDPQIARMRQIMREMRGED